MTRLLIPLVLLTFAFVPSPARADYADAVRAYRACVDYLKQSRARQVQIAKGSGYTLKQVDWACRKLRAEGPPSRGATRPGPATPRTPPAPQPRSCAGGSWCHLDQHCVDRRCVDKLRVTCANSGLRTCTAGEKCVNGVCR